MSYATILAVVSGADDDAATISLAADLAKRQGALARVLAVYPQMTPTGWADTFGAGAFSGELWQAIAAAGAEFQKKTADLVRVTAAQLDMPFGTEAAGALTMLSEPTATLWAGLTRELPLTDLLVVGASAVHRDGVWLGVLDEAVVALRCPTLVARGPAAPADRPAVIAWDGSPQAGRAVRAALPLLRDASQVIILQDPTHLDDSEADIADPERLAADLRRRGLASVAVARIKGHGGKDLAEAARAYGAGLLVAGAYGHSRLREAVLGGATRSLLEAADGPHLLIAH